MYRFLQFMLATMTLLLAAESLLFAQPTIATPTIATLSAAATTAANTAVIDATTRTSALALAVSAASAAVATPSAATAGTALTAAINAVAAANKAVSSANAVNTAANAAVLAVSPAAPATIAAATATATTLASAINAATAANNAFTAASALVTGPVAATAAAFSAAVTAAVAAAATAATDATAAAMACTAASTAATAAVATTATTPSPAPVVDVTNSPYRLLVGTNLDFNEKAIDVNGLYAKVDVLIDNQHGGPYASNWLLKNISLIGNIYLNQSLSGDYSDTLSHRRTERTLIRSLSNDTVTAVAIAATTVKAVTRVKSLGFVLQPTIRLFNNQDPPESPLVHPHSSFYAGLHLEVARRAYITNYSYSEQTPLDTLRIPKLSNQPFNYALAIPRPTEETVIFYERYYGISFPYRYISQDIDLRFIPSFGLAYLYPGEYVRYMTATLDITERNSGITFGAEIRDYASLRQRPVLSLYLSKAFLLSRLGAFLNGRT